MASLRRWRQVGHGQFHKWDTPGDELEGRWIGTHEGRFGPLGSIDAPDGVITFPLHTALFDRLRRIPEGTDVLIRYTGRQTSRAGRVFKSFDVFMAGDDAVVPAGEPMAGADGVGHELD
jgi:hypothetical protein